MSTTNTLQTAGLVKKLNPLLKFIAVCALITLVCIVYLVLVGIPRTQARQKYNEATAAYALSDFNQSLILAKEAYNIWPEQYFLELIQLTQHQLNTDSQKLIP